MSLPVGLAAGGRTAGTIWIEVDDLFEFAARNRRPTGIQRVVFEISRALALGYEQDGRVRFVRYGSRREPVEIVPFAAIAELFGRLSDAPDEPGRPPPTDSDLPRPDAARRLVSSLLGRAPRDLRDNALRFARAEREALKALRALVVSFRRPRSAPRRPDVAGPARRGAARFDGLAAPGDVFLVLGSPWYRQDYATFIDRLRRDRGLRLAILVHDVMPLQHPEWCARVVSEAFRPWFKSVLPLADTIFSTSSATAREIEAEANRIGIHLSSPIEPIPLGTGFTLLPSAREALPRIPRPGSYALVVSTIEPRKNHQLLLRVWRQLLAELPGNRVPGLVLAGKVGWMARDLIQQFASSDWLNGKVRLIEAPTDQEIAALYRGALFTILPSFAEGWGLPVSESLAQGTPCLAADRPSLREAGGGLARYFDPDNLHDAVRAIRALLMDPADLAQWTEQVRREFRPVSWETTADRILELLDRHGFSPDPQAIRQYDAVDRGRRPGPSTGAVDRDHNGGA